MHDFIIDIVLESGTGSKIAWNIYTLLEDWNISDKIIDPSYYSTATNTGVDNGACKILEYFLERPLLWLICCHHIMELIASE